MLIIEKTLADLDVDAVDFESGSWSWGRGGHPLSEQDFAISHVDKDFKETRYAMPKCINKMLKSQFQQGEDEAKRAIQQALGV